MSKITLNHIKSLIGIGLFGFALGSAAPAMADCPNSMSGTGLDAANACQIKDWNDLASIGLEATHPSLGGIYNGTPDNTGILGFHYKLMNDLDEDSAGYASHNPWVPIRGPFVPSFFFGTFDGNGFSIKDINFNDATADRFGLFERLTGGEVFNLTISDFTVKAGGGMDSQQGVGMIAPLVQSSPSAATQERGTTIQNVVIKNGTIEVTSPMVGGLVGLAQSDTSIADIAVDNVTISIVGGSLPLGDVGGVVGRIRDTDLERVYFNGTIKVTNALAPAHRFGGVVGELDLGSTITDAYAVGSLSAESNEARIGGIAGFVRNSANATNVIKNVYSAVEISGNGGLYIGALLAQSAGSLDTETLLNTSFYDVVQGAVSPGPLSQGTSASTSDMLTSELYEGAGWNFDTVWQQVEGTSYPYFKQAPIQAPAPQPRTITCPTGLDADTDGACLVKNWDDLKKLPDAPVLSYRLANDINAQSGGYMTDWTPLALFGGTLDGNGKTISGLTIVASNDNGTGLFSEIGAIGRVSDLALVDFSITWSGKKKVGSLAGILSGVVENSYFQGTIVRGFVSGTQHGVGGVVGSVPATASNARLERVAADVSIDTGSSGQWVGGIAGELRSGTLKDSYFSGELKGTGNSQGGLVGLRLSAATITNSYSSANFTATNTPTVGGINLGGSAGVTSSYWDQGVIGNVTLSSDSGGEARETVEMKSRSTFSGWDFGSSSLPGVWSIIEEATVVNGDAATKVSYPYLTSLANLGFIDITDANVTGEQTITPPLELAATSPFTPAASAQDVVPFTAIRVEFAEDIAAVTNTSAITLKDSSSAGVSAAVAISGARVTITPNSLLSYDETYTVTIPAGTLKSVANADRVNITVSWSFSTQSANVVGGDGCPARMINFTEDPNDLECIVTNWAQLSAIGASVDNLGLKYVLDNDLGPETLGYEELVATPTNGWASIGSAASEPFHGVFDGQGFILTGLKSNVGLFSEIAQGHVKNLVLRDVDIAGGSNGSNIGALAGSVDHDNLPSGATGQTDTRIEQVFASGRIEGRSSIGGLIGLVKPGTTNPLILSELGFAGTVNAGTTSTSSNVGGLIGRIFPQSQNTPAGDITMSSVYFVGHITAGDFAGGLIGSHGTISSSAWGHNVNISDAYVSVDFTLGGVQENSGALFGTNYGDIVLDTDVYWLSEENWVPANGTSTQPPIPTALKSNSKAPTGENMVEVTSETMLGTVAATTLTDFDFASNAPIWEVVTENTPGAFGDSLPILKNLDTETQVLAQLGPRQCSADIANGFGIEVAPCEISNWNELRAINEFRASFYKLTSNLDKNSAGYSSSFAPLGSAGARDAFSGTFDGNNLTISDLVIRETSNSNTLAIGLFASLGVNTNSESRQATVKNLTLANVDISSVGGRVGALAGGARLANVDNVHSSGKVTGADNTGGLIGVLDGTNTVVINNSSSSATVSGALSTGGLVGSSAGAIPATISNSFATGAVTSSRGWAGGLLGQGYGTIEDSFATGDVSAPSTSGGLVGRLAPGKPSVLNRVFATGDVAISGSEAGGLIGFLWFNGDDVTITDAYATGDVSGESALGGLVGKMSGGELIRTFASGLITSSRTPVQTAGRIGGLVGEYDNRFNGTITATNSYWDAQSTGQSSSAGSDDAAGLTTAQMTGAAASTNMTGFVFGESGAWSVTTQAQTPGAFADGYPHLKAPLPLLPQLNGQNIGLGSIGVNIEGVALTLFNDIIAADNLNIELSADNAAALQAAATAASTIVNVANGTQPRADLTLAMLTGIGIDVDADDLNGATIAIRGVTDTATISSVAGIQGVINAGVTAFEDAAPVFDDFFEEKPGSTPPSADDYTDIGVKDVTTENAPAINDLVANTGIDSIDPEGIQNVVDVYNEIIDALSDDPVRDPDLTAIDYAALGLGDIITNDDAADLLSSLLAEEGVTTIKAWGSATPATTFDNLKSRAELAAKVIAGANGDPATPAALVTADLEGLGVDTLLTTEPQVDFFNEVIGGSTGPEVSSVETLQAMAGAVGPVLGGTADIDDYNAIGLDLTNGMLGIFDEVLGGVQETPITYATIKGIADATSNLINLAAGVGSTNPLPILEVLKTLLGVDAVDQAVIDASSEVYLAIAGADPTTLTSVAALDTLVTNAVTAANTFELTVVNGSLSGGYVSGTSVTLVANSAPEGQYFAGWTGATVADSDAPVTTLTMPAAATTVTATFQNIPEPKFNLTVASGTGAGSYEAGQQITISANLPAEGKIFDRWTGGDGVIDNPTASVATLVMPANALTVTATYIDDPNQLFGLNVGSGSGSGEYKAGDRVAIGANPAAEDKMFDRWGGDVQYIDNAANPNTRVTMPRDSVTVVAIYVDKPDPKFDLAITGGEGTGQFVAGTSITISAGIPAEGKLFDRWLGDTAYVDNVNESNTQVTMPAGNVSLRASYADIPDPLFTLSVEGGQGDGDYEAGDVVTISAGLPPTGQIFDQWIGQTSRLGNVSQPNTTLTMPASDVSIRATYKAKPVTRFALSVTSGTGEGSYEQGQVVTIEANVPAADQVFDRWTGQTGALANVNVPNTTLVMPGSNISVTATYKADPDSTPTLGRGRGRGRSLEGGKPGPFTGRQLVDELIEEQIPAGTFVALTAPEAPVVIVNNEPVDFYFDKWVGQTAYLNNVHATTAFMVMPDHDLTVLAQFRSIDGTMTVTADGTTVTLEGAAITADSELTPGSVVQVVAAAPASGFMFDKWIGQTAYLSNVNVPETNLTVPGTNVEIRATYRRIPDGDTSVSIAGADAEAQTPGTYIALEAAAPAVGESFDLWGGQNSYVENVFAANSRMFVPATSVSVAPVYKSAFGSGVDPEAAEAILDFDGSQSTAPSAAVYESAGITGVNASNVAVYNAALVALGPTQLSEVQAVVTTYNAILAAANGNASTPATLTVADYAVLGVTVAAGEELAVVNQAVGSQSAAGVDTIAKVEAIAASAARFLTVAGGGTPSTALTPADFARLGFAGITNANIDEAIAVLVQAVSDGADPADIGTLQALFDALAPPPLPVPTLSTWMLLLMALMMWMVIQSRRALLDR